MAELGYRAATWPGIAAPSPDATGGRVSIYNLRGELGPAEAACRRVLDSNGQ